MPTRRRARAIPASDQEGEVLRRVPRRMEHVDADVADADAIAVFQLARMLELILPVLIALIRKTKTGARPVRQLARPRNIVRVNVGFGDVRDPQPLLCGGPDVVVDIPISVDDDGFVGLLAAN